MTVLNGLNLATGCSALHIPHQEQGLTDVANGSAKTNGSVAVVLYFLCSHHGCLLLLGSGFAQSIADFTKQIAATYMYTYKSHRKPWFQMFPANFSHQTR
jgi:hypothetical protein